MTAEKDGQLPNIRRAGVEEAATLSDLALRSKAHWGYDADFLEACRAELTLSPAYLAEHHVYVIEEDGRVIGFYSLRAEEGSGVALDHLFIEPKIIGRGYGKSLWQHAVRTATSLGYSHLTIESEPHAEPFYRAMGATCFASVPSSVRPGRILPVLHFVLPAARIAQ